MVWECIKMLFINKIPEYNPHGLEAWLEKQDKGLQEDGKECGRQIEKHIKVRILNKLEETLW